LHLSYPSLNIPWTAYLCIASSVLPALVWHQFSCLPLLPIRARRAPCLRHPPGMDFSLCVRCSCHDRACSVLGRAHLSIALSTLQVSTQQIVLAFVVAVMPSFLNASCLLQSSWCVGFAFVLLVMALPLDDIVASASSAAQASIACWHGPCRYCNCPVLCGPPLQRLGIISSSRR